jgi:hypothetical protein
MEQNSDPITDDYRKTLFVGSSTEADEGGPTLEKAFEDAYEKAKQQGKKPPFKVHDIWLHGTNPLTEYRVVVGSGS